jgi:RNA-directed DNA polymerase
VNYYRYGNSLPHFTKIRTYALQRLVLFAAKRHNRTPRFGWTVVNYHSRNQLGLISLDGLVVTPKSLPRLAGQAGPTECRR